MSSPPFNIAETTPADDDFASQFPTAERAFREVVESWLLINHNTNGRHDEVALDFKADPSAPGASITEVWASSTGNAAGILKQRSGSAGSVEYVGVPPGVVSFTAAATVDTGYLLCDGAAVSRTTYARLFDRIGTVYGTGDGSTTFNIPDIDNRIIVGKGSSGRVTTAGSSVDGTTLGATGGAQNVTIAQANLPSVTLTTTIASGQGSHTHLGGLSTTPDGGASATLAQGGTAGGSFGDVQHISTNTLPAMSGTTPLGGSGTALNKMPPVIVLLPQIKT